MARFLTVLANQTVFRSAPDKAVAILFGPLAKELESPRALSLLRVYSDGLGLDRLGDRGLDGGDREFQVIEAHGAE